jgi:predicted O-methyltransferase YrrM
VVEIGVWAGRSLVPMALALKALNKGKIIGIDPWDAKASIEGMTGENLKWWQEVDHEKIFQQCCDWLTRAGINLFVDIHRCRSDQFQPPPQIDILHIDGCHGEKASCYDVDKYADKVRVGGLLFMDDVLWARKATDKLAGLGFVELYKMDTGSMYQRIRI